MALNCSICNNKIGIMETLGSLSPEYPNEKICSKCLNKKKELLFGDSSNFFESVEYFEKCKVSGQAKSEVFDIVDSWIEQRKNTIEYEQNIINEKQRERIQKEEAAKNRELEHIKYAKSFNEFFEYDVVTIINKDHGIVDKKKMMDILSEHARSGWKLHTIYSNELGKNALSIMGFGTNATACEDVLIFERRVQEVDS